VSAPYLHDGSAPTLETAVRAHAGTTITDADLASLVQYLREIGSDETTAPASPGTGTGLPGTYFNNVTVTGAAVLTRTEAVDFNWGSRSPGGSVAANNFSVRWSGYLLVPATGTYRFQTNADDGARLWVGNGQVINSWTNNAGTASSAGVNLVAGQRVPVRLEYYEKGGNAAIQLRWLTPGDGAYVTIPASRLAP
jgi:hypothetical protein